MGFKDAYNWALEHHETTAIIVASGFLPYGITETINTFSNGIERDGAVLAAMKTLSPLVAFNIARFVTILLKAYTLNSPVQRRTKLKDYEVLIKLKSRMKELNPPQHNYSKVRKVQLDLSDVWIKFKHLFDYSKEEIFEHFKKKRNPLFGLAAASRSFHANEFDSGLDELRLTFDEVRGIIQPSIFSNSVLNIYQLAGFMGRTLAPADPRMYLFSAAYAALTNPKKAWYYSELGRMVADEFDSPFRKEMYVCHALLASAQGRSDEEDAWSDAVRVAKEGAEWERLGESRSVVRVIKNGTFFRNTFLFKNKDSLEDALWEKKCYDALSGIEGVTVPRTLYCSKQPEDGTYTLVMRVLAGETLYDKLKKGEQEAVPSVITALANIHSLFPTEKLKPANLEERIRKGVRALNLPDQISNAIAENYAPVALALNNSTWAWNKDAHPENWIIGETIGVIDCEARNTSPVLCDVVNLLEYADFFTTEKKHEYIEQYIEVYNAKGGTLNKETAPRDYHNAVVHRMICFASAWSDSTRPNLHAKRAAALLKGAAAINTLREEHTDWYNTHCSKYEQLEQALLNAAKLMAAYTS